MRFKICWTEFTDKTGKELEDFMQSLPNPRVTGAYYTFDQDNKEIECTDYFGAKNIEEAIKKVSAYDVEIFTVFNAKTGQRLFTEEDLITQRGDV